MTDLPESWAVCTIADVTTPIQMIASSDTETREISYIDISSIDNRLNRIAEPKRLSLAAAPSRARQIVKSGDVLFSTVRPYLRNIAAVPDNLHGQIASTGFAVLRAGAGVVPAYLFYKAISRDFVAALTGEQYGVSYPAVKEDQVRSQPFELPPLAEQHRIVAKIEALFSELDAGQDSLTRAQAQLRHYRQSLLKAAFQGRLTADWRAANPDKLESPETLLSRIRSERDARYKQALDDWQNALAQWRAGGEVGRKPGKPSRPEWPQQFDFGDLTPLPFGWVYLPFEGVAYTIRNGISQRPDEAGSLKIFRISAVRPMVFDLSDFRYLVADDEFDDFRLQQGDLVFTRYNGSRAFVGVAAIYRGDGSHVYPDKLIRCDVASDRLDPGYLEKAVNCGEPRAFIEKRIRTTAGQAGISGADLKAMPVPICGPEEQGELNRILDEKLSQVDAMETEITTALAKITALRQSILKQAFSGHLVPQDPADEPASALLARLRANDNAATLSKRRKKQA